MIKKEMYICPKCGGDCTETYDFEVEQNSLVIKCHCSECNEAWYEYFALTYGGYSHCNKVYDAKGNIEIDFNDMLNATKEDIEMLNAIKEDIENC